jgi:hypothetical protein
LLHRHKLINARGLFLWHSRRVAAITIRVSPARCLTATTLGRGCRLRSCFVLNEQARNEDVRITAPVRMVCPDEIPALALSLIHLARPASGVAAIPASSMSGTDLMPWQPARREKNRQQ